MVKTRSKIETQILKSVSRKQIKYESLSLPYSVEYSYTPDFILTTKSGKDILIETKGGQSYRYFNSQYRKKWLSMYSQYKDQYDIRLIFEKDFKIGKKMTASDWCKKHGIEYHIGLSIPRKWID